ncbi:MAG: hypothetical protein OM95_16770 [Bdellovibrio sp. ArHS]|uniref:TIGR02147 family protein n=1 Tax=Bdellovibrio sp. ArHS TaxID=1569284 RepID=UPI0005839C2C|nr:TIGR02147 family protein [Bdellovibrio sp. ArHS]KHD87004.1 MAG: hypothetical protein OM95_16770 [Bdellovibrio sp. ArHS]
MSESNHPDVKSYLNIYQFLQDSYQYLKKSGDFSYEIWAQKLGVASKSYLRFAVLGQRKISDVLAQRLCEFFQLSETDREYFLLLVLYTQTKQEAQRNLYGRKLTQLLRRSLEVEDVAPPDELLANPLSVVVRNLLSFSDIPGTAEALAQVLGVSSKEIQDLLESLELAELVVRTEGRWQAVHDVVRVKDRSQSLALQRYHKASLERAIQAQQLPPEQRHYRALSVALSETEYLEYLQDLNEFATAVFSKFNTGAMEGRRLYQLNFNAFPWTEPVVLKL